MIWKLHDPNGMPTNEKYTYGYGITINGKLNANNASSVESVTVYVNAVTSTTFRVILI